MKKSVLEKWYKKGRLQSDNINISAEQRLWAAQLLFYSYTNSHILSEGVSDWLRVNSKGNVPVSVIESKLAQKDLFLKAYAQIPSHLRFVVQKIVLENKELEGHQCDMKLFVAMLCKALDNLVCYYISTKENNK